MLALSGTRTKTIDNLKPKDWTALGINKATRDLMDEIYERKTALNAFLRDMLGFTITQFKANITAETVQLLQKMGLQVEGKATVANYKKMLEEMIDENPFLRHSNPAICLAKCLYFQGLENLHAEKEDYDDDEEEEEVVEVKPKKKGKTAKKTVQRLQHQSDTEDDE